MKTDVGWGQCHVQPINLIQNPNFIMGEPCTLPDNNGSNSFGVGCVVDWFGPLGSAHHIIPEDMGNGQFRCSIIPVPPPIYDGTEIPCVGASETICQNVPIFEDPYVSYSFSIDVRGIDCIEYPVVNFDLEIALTRGAFNWMGWSAGTNLPKQNLLTFLVNSTSFTTITIPQFQVQANSGYNQIWIGGLFPTTNLEGVVTFDNALLTCQSSALTSINVEKSQLVCSFAGINASQNHDFTTFHWNFGDGSTSNEEFPTHAYQFPGTYNVCLSAISEIGCCAYRCVEVVVICDEAPNPIIHRRTNFCSSYTFSIENPDPSMTYTWSIPGGSPSTGSGTIFSTMITQNGTYTVSVTGQNACHSVSSSHTFEVQCSSEPPSCTNQTNCVFIGTDINSVTRLSDLVTGNNPVIPSTQFFFSYVISNLCFNVEGKLIIDIPQVFFTNTNWFMGPGAEIEITPANFFGSRWFADSHFQGCDYMWRGIVVKANNPPGWFGNGGLSLIQSTIEDAWRGVELDNNTVLSASLSNFFDNYIGVKVGNPLVPANNVVTDFSSTVFEDTDNMLPAYPGQPDYSPRFFAGIVANNVTQIIIGNANGSGKNTFKNLLFGIRSHLSNLFVHNNDFIDTYWNGATSGILVDGTGPITNIESDNTFINISNDIYINGYGCVPSNISIIGNNESIRRKSNPGDSRSIHILNNISSSVTIKDYYIFGNDLGIKLEGEFKNLKVENNELNVEGPRARFIDINNVNSSGNVSSISNNNIFFDLSVPYANTSLFKILDCSYLSVFNNVIYNNSGVSVGSASTAFDVSGTDKSLFKENKIY